MTLIIGQSGGRQAYAGLVRATPGLVAYYRLNDASGNFAEDSGGTALTTTGTHTYHAAGLTSDGDYAVSAGTQPIGSRAIGSIPVGLSARSFEFIYKGTDQRQTILSYGAQSTRNWWTIAFSFDGSDRIGLETWSDDQRITGAGVFDGNPHHLVYTYAGSTNQVKVYKDGSLLGTLTFGGNLNTSSSTLQVGQNTAGSYYLNGTLDELAIYSVALDTTTIAAHAAAR